MWQKFSEGARRIVYFAQEEAQRLDVTMVTPKHLLLGLTREANNVAFVILYRLGVPPEMLREQLLLNEAVYHESLGGKNDNIQDMQLSPEARRALKEAEEESKELNNIYIGSEHILAGILREVDGPETQLLLGLGIDAAKVRQQILDYQDPLPGEIPDSPPSSSPLPFAH